MEYLIIILVIAVALAPLSHFLPSKRQRAVAKMRETAALRGLFVEFRQLPGQRGAETARTTSSRDGVIYYGKRLPPARGSEPRRGAWLRVEQGWRSARGVDSAPEILDDLPAAALAASVDEGSCGVYWRESGVDDDLATIIGIIERWSVSLQTARR
jgi:hypothetical protein